VSSESLSSSGEGGEGGVALEDNIVRNMVGILMCRRFCGFEMLKYSCLELETVTKNSMFTPGLTAQTDCPIWSSEFQFHRFPPCIFG